VTNPAALVSLVTQGCRRLGIDLPDPVAAAVARPVPLLEPPDRAALAAAVTAAALDGRDPATDPDVVRLLTLVQLDGLGIGRDLHTAAEQVKAAAIIDHADEILAALAAVVDQADQTLTDARPRLPRGVDLADRAGGVTLRGADAMQAWGAAREHLDRLTGAVTVWRQVVTATAGLQVPDRHPHAPLILAPLTVDQFDALPVRGALAPALAGHRLALATPQDYAERVAAIDTERRRRQLTADAEGRRRAAGSSGRSLVPQ
jgi:hypothetical protein